MFSESIQKRIREIKENPDRHQHSFQGLLNCTGGDPLLMEAHEGAIRRTNGGRRCDTNDGPCSCGAWH
jgi:hypothetical protein